MLGKDNEGELKLLLARPVETRAEALGELSVSASGLSGIADVFVVDLEQATPVIFMPQPTGAEAASEEALPTTDLPQPLDAVVFDEVMDTEPDPTLDIEPDIELADEPIQSEAGSVEMSYFTDLEFPASRENKESEPEAESAEDEDLKTAAGSLLGYAGPSAKYAEPTAAEEPALIEEPLPIEELEFSEGLEPLVELEPLEGLESLEGLEPAVELESLEESEPAEGLEPEEPMAAATNAMPAPWSWPKVELEPEVLADFSDADADEGGSEGEPGSPSPENADDGLQGWPWTRVPISVKGMYSQPKSEPSVALKAPADPAGPGAGSYSSSVGDDDVSSEPPVNHGSHESFAEPFPALEPLSPRDSAQLLAVRQASGRGHSTTLLGTSDSIQLTEIAPDTGEPVAVDAPVEVDTLSEIDTPSVFEVEPEPSGSGLDADDDAVGIPEDADILDAAGPSISEDAEPSAEQNPNAEDADESDLDALLEAVPALEEEEPVGYKPSESTFGLDGMTCDDCAYADTCVYKGDRTPNACDMFQWK
ncbi:MAG: hypothetical protein FWE94_08165 [Coriobacteriia bacterium]|nr:hypothetical protein [Coriobacteriia bacterium]